MDMQNVSNLVIPEGNVRTIHDKNNRLIWGRLAYDTKYAGNTLQNGTPTPTTPINVDVATGTQTVTVTGKNLWNPVPYQPNHYIGADGTESTNNSIDTWGNVYAGSSTVMSIQIKSSHSGTGILRVHAFSTNGVWLSQIATLTVNAGTLASTTFTTPNQPCFVRWCYYNTPSPTNCQLELGSITEYEPYQGSTYTINLGTTELCKIGDYQDYIYKNGDDWYVHKATNKVILNGSEAWGGANGKYSYSDPTIISQPLGVDVPPIAFSNYLAASNYTAVVNDLADNIIAGYYNGGQFRTRVTSYATVNDWKTWLTTHNLTVYYQLATPTDTQITDTNLITQLNNIHQFLTRYGYNSNVSGNLPIIIDKTDLS